MTVLEVIQRSSAFLTRKGVDSARLQVELLLAQVLGLPRLELYLAFDRTLTDRELDALRGRVQRRGTREPLQHIIGSANFCGYEITVNRHVLVPRPETEILTEQAWRFLAEVARRKGAAPLALDVGTGSGCLAVALAKQCPQSRIDALDISPDALSTARANAAKHQIADRIRFFESDGLSALPEGSQYDLIVSNPPYIPSAQIADLQPEVRDYEPRLALDGGEDGLAFHRRLLHETGPFLAQAGRLMLEMGDGQETELSRITTQCAWRIEAIHPDDTGRARILIASREA